jgi:hypothetical protein
MPNGNGHRDWNATRSLLGGSDFVPAAIHRLLTASSAPAADTAYWELDNRVVVQGQLFEAALPTAIAVAEAICGDRDIRNESLGRVFDLLVEIAYGEPDESELRLGNATLGDRCRAELRRFAGCFREYATRDDEKVQLGALDLLDRIELDRHSLRVMATELAAHSTSAKVRERARELIF